MRLRFVIFQDAPGLWLVRGLEHDVTAEASTIGQAVRAVTRLVHAHLAFDQRHAHPPLGAFPPAPQRYWNAYATGTALSLAQLGVSVPPEWDIQAAFAARRPSDALAGPQPSAGRRRPQPLYI
ncbi:MAG TPA: hypothetical protein VG222_12865 [Vicinamibacterales bacterium]|nr:hypothetical protein [Vicinamibacterales bacterium]